MGIYSRDHRGNRMKKNGSAPRHGWRARVKGVPCARSASVERSVNLQAHLITAYQFRSINLIASIQMACQVELNVRCSFSNRLPICPIPR